MVTVSSWVWIQELAWINFSRNFYCSLTFMGAFISKKACALKNRNYSILKGKWSMNKTRCTVPVFQWRPQCHKLRGIAFQFFYYAFIYTVPVQLPGNNSATTVRQREKWSCVVLKTYCVSGVSFQLCVSCPAKMEGNASLQMCVDVDRRTLGHSVQRKWRNEATSAKISCIFFHVTIQRGSLQQWGTLK